MGWCRVVLIFGIGLTGLLCAQEPTDVRAFLLPDLQEREALPQTRTPEPLWYRSENPDAWGPQSAVYPGVEELVQALPVGTDVLRWKRERVIAVAEHYIGLPYRHHHIPAFHPKEPNSRGEVGPGLDCSNFTAWVYNFGLGIILNSEISKQADATPRRGFDAPPFQRIVSMDALLPGDLLFIRTLDDARISHVVIYIDAEHIIDSHLTGVEIRPFAGWYRNHFAHALRYIF